MTPRLRQLCRKLRLNALKRDGSGIALTEFAISFPVVMALGMYGIDVANLALTNLRLNQIALNLADNASRVGLVNSSAKQAIRQIDVDDVFQAANNQGSSLNLKTNGRIILSSLEKNSSGVQRLHWQRCFGTKTGATYESHYGKATNSDGTETDSNNNGVIDASEILNPGIAAPNGMGKTGAKVNAPTNDSGVMFVEINYRYTPMFSWLSAPADLRFVASFIVRDPRDFSALYPSPTATQYPCNYTPREAPP